MASLKFAMNDASSIHRFLHCDDSFEKIYLFTEKADPIETDYGESISSNPSFTNLKYFIRKRFNEPFLQPEDHLWFFFSGHGMRRNEEDYILASDTDPGDIEATGISVSALLASLKSSGSKNITLFIDACRDKGEKTPLGSQSIHCFREEGTVAFFSCYPGELSYEIDELENSSFCHSLLKALRIHSRNTLLTVEELNRYLDRTVKENNYRYGKPSQSIFTAVEPLGKLSSIVYFNPTLNSRNSSLENFNELDEKGKVRFLLSRQKYSVLTQLIIERKWEKADHLTRRVMLKEADREKYGWIRPVDAEYLSCEFLFLLDYIWNKLGDSKFGFYKQKEIWQAQQGNTLSEKSHSFATSVGWREKDFWLSHKNYNYSINSPQGHLPSKSAVCELGFPGSLRKTWLSLYSTLDACSL